MATDPTQPDEGGPDEFAAMPLTPIEQMYSDMDDRSMDTALDTERRFIEAKKKREAEAAAQPTPPSILSKGPPPQ